VTAAGLAVDGSRSIHLTGTTWSFDLLHLAVSDNRKQNEPRCHLGQVCDGLKAFIVRLVQSPPQQAAAVAASDGQFLRATIVDDDGVQRRWRARSEAARG
jgi:hypothetical protein